MTKFDFAGEIKKGKLFTSYRHKFDTCIATFDDCRIKGTIEKIYKKRSTKTPNF